MNDATVRVNITARMSELAIVDRAAKRAHMSRSAYLVLSAIERAEALAKEAGLPKDINGYQWGQCRLKNTISIDTDRTASLVS